jgi:hypothetical protein
MRRFSGGRERYACFIVSYGGFADAAGRNGLINHARVVRLEPDAVWFDPLPLVALAEDFPVDEIRSGEPKRQLEAYLERLKDEDVVTVRPLSRQELKPIARDGLREVLLATLGAIGDPRGRRRVRAPQIALTQLARAWAALPVGLQRKSAWAYGANDGGPLTLLWSNDRERVSSEQPSDATRRCVDGYLRLLLDTNYDLRQIVTDEDVDLAAFTQIVQQASATAVTVLPERHDMPKKTKEPEPPRPRGRGDSAPLDSAELAAELDRQYRQMEASLRNYVDLRLGGHEASRAAEQTASRGSDVPLKTPSTPYAAPGWKGMLDRFGIPIAVTAGVLLLLGAMYVWKPWGRDRVRSTGASTNQEQEQEQGYTEPEPAGNDPAVTESTPSTEPAQASPYLRTLIAETAASSKPNKWPEAFLAFTERQPATVAALTNAAWGHPTTTADIRGKLAALRDRLNGQGKPLAATDRAALRNYLVQYIAAEVTAGQPGVTIDDKMNDLKPAVMQRVLQETKTGGSSTDASNAALQSEVILRWLESHPL